MRAPGIHFEEMSNRLGEFQLFVTDPRTPTWEFRGPPDSRQVGARGTAIPRGPSAAISGPDSAQKNGSVGGPPSVT